MWAHICQSAVRFKGLLSRYWHLLGEIKVKYREMGHFGAKPLVFYHNEGIFLHLSNMLSKPNKLYASMGCRLYITKLMTF